MVEIDKHREMEYDGEVEFDGMKGEGPRGVSTMPVQQPPSFMEMVERLASRPEVDVSKIEKILDMQEKILDRKAQQEFSESMVAVQGAMPTILKDKENLQTRSKYSQLETIIKAASPIYTKEGFSLSFYEGETPKPEHIRVCCDIMHIGGHKETRHADFAIDTKGIKGTPNKTLIHGEGSTFSYGRRYLTCMIFNISTGDDVDGNGVEEEKPPATKEMVETMQRVIDSKKIDAKLFCEHMGADSVESILASDFKKAMNVLQRAKGQVEKEPPPQERVPGQEG